MLRNVYQNAQVFLGGAETAKSFQEKQLISPSQSCKDKKTKQPKNY